MYIARVKFGDTFSPGCMFRPRDRRMDTLGLRHKKLFALYSFVTWWGKRIWLPSNQCCPWSHSAWGRLTHCSQSLASDRPPQRFAEPGKSFHSFLKMLHLHEHYVDVNNNNNNNFTCTSITLMSIKAVTEIPIMAPPFRTRTATWAMAIISESI